MQTAVNKAIRVGRATMLAIGLAVTLALVLGVATVALAAVPGDPFRLGQVNIINNATTTLQGNGPSGPPLGRPLVELKRDGSNSGPALRVENASTNGIQGSGISIKVPLNRPPLSVNPDAGTASFLSADKLDGKDQEDFLPSRIYSKTALKAGPGGGGEVFFFAGDGSEGLDCDDGDVAISAGATSNDINDDLVTIMPTSPGSYQIRLQDNGTGGGLFRATTVCSDSAKPFRD